MTNDLEILSKLLQNNNLISDDNLGEAIKFAKSLDVSLERALTMLKLISDNRLRSAVAAKDIINTGDITLENASKILKYANQNDISFEAALQEIKQRQVNPTVSHPLAELSLAAKLLSQDRITDSLEKAQLMEIPLGKVLIVNRSLTRWTLGEILTSLRLLKEEIITSDQAAQYLRDAIQHRVSIMQLLFEAGLYCGAHGDTITLLELLFISDCLTEADYQDVEETQLIESKPYAQILAERNLVEPKLLEAAIELLEMSGNYLRPFQAAEALKQIKTKQIPVYQAIAELKPPPQIQQPELRIGDLLIEAGITTRDAIEGIVTNPQANTTIRIGKQLLAAKLIGETDLYNALRCQSLVREGIFSSPQAISVLSCTHHEKLKLEEAFSQRGSHALTRMQWSWR